jgi:hypothetical protein
VLDSPQAAITAQVEAGVVVRMAVLYELLEGNRAPSPKRRRGQIVAASDDARRGEAERASEGDVGEILAARSGDGA